MQTTLDWFVDWDEPNVFDVIPEFVIGFYNHRLIWRWPHQYVHCLTDENAGDWILSKGWWNKD